MKQMYDMKIEGAFLTCYEGTFLTSYECNDYKPISKVSCLSVCFYSFFSLILTTWIGI